MGGRAGGGASGGMGSRSKSGADRFYTFSLGNGQTVTVNKNKTPQQVVKQANKLKKQLTQTIQGMEGYNNIHSYSDLMGFKVKADNAKGKSVQKVMNALHLGKSLTKVSRGGKMT